jgi:toxin ParE1/3/4
LKVVWTAPADRDTDAIWEHVAKDDIDAADYVCDRLRSLALMLESHREIGRRGSWTGTRELVAHDLPYFLVYRIANAKVEILRVIHGAQDWPRSRK